MSPWRTAWVCGFVAVFLAGCGDDATPIDPADITDTSGPDDSTSGPDLTTGPTTSTSTDPTASSSSTTSTGSTGGTTDGTGSTGTGGIVVDPPSGVPNYSLVNAGHDGSSENYRMIYTLGQLSPAQQTQTSPEYRLQGGVVGANGTLP